MLGQQNLVERAGFEPAASETRGLQPRRDTGFPIRTIVWSIGWDSNPRLSRFADVHFRPLSHRCVVCI